MIARDYVLATIPSLVMLAVMPIVESIAGSRQLASAVTAVVLTWPVAMASLVWMRQQRDPRRAAIGWIAATLLRLTIATIGSLLVYLAADWTEAAGLAFWLWIVVAYLSTLAAEVFVLAKPGWIGRGGAGRKG